MGVEGWYAIVVRDAAMAADLLVGLDGVAGALQEKTTAGEVHGEHQVAGEAAQGTD